jgi:hypothetical protein
MNEKIVGNGPAFPSCQWYGDSHSGHTLGLSKREYFAAQALQGFFSGVPFDAETPLTEADRKYFQEIARTCYEMADAMVAEGNK